MEKWGYVRVSVDRKLQAAGWEDQIATLKELGVTDENMRMEEASTRTARPVFEKMIASANHEATPQRKICICAAKMDRAFRDLAAADAAIFTPQNPNVIWLLPDLSKNPLDPTDPTQMLLVRMMGAVAQFERDRLAERRAYGIAKAKKEGKYKGRAPTARAKAPEVLKLRERGFRPDEIAKQLEIGRASVFRILRHHRESQPSNSQ
ncbi:MAG: recombinase family protein [Pseudomonadota bacterium]